MSSLIKICQTQNRLTSFTEVGRGNSLTARTFLFVGHTPFAEIVNPR